MNEQQNESSAAQPRPENEYQVIVNRLTFAALKEQTRARRWRIFFMSFFVIYLSVITVIILDRSSDSGFQTGNEDGEEHTAVVKLSGVIAGDEAASAENISSGLRAAFKHDDTAVVVLEINSPGGSPVQSAYIFDEIRRLKLLYPDIPLYAVVADIAASGGYFVAAASDRIFVNKSSLVGSIGVRMDSFGFVELIKKLGVERRLLTAGANKGLFDPFLPEDANQKSHLESLLGEVHQHFIEAVKQGRGERLQTENDLFSGLVWSGERALALGLVDDYGSTDSIARELKAENIVDFTPKSELLDRIAERIGTSLGQQLSQQLIGEYVLK